MDTPLTWLQIKKNLSLFTKTAGIRPPSPVFLPVVTWNKLFHVSDSSFLTITSYSTLNSSLQSDADQTWSLFVKATLPFLEKMCWPEMVYLLILLRARCNEVKWSKWGGKNPRGYLEPHLFFDFVSNEQQCYEIMSHDIDFFCSQKQLIYLAKDKEFVEQSVCWLVQVLRN